jgi:hypothetical protein
MAINMNQLVDILIPVGQQDMITELIRNYLVLKYRINHQDEQSFYFRMASESNDNKLKKMKAEYEEHSQKINNLSIDDLVSLKIQAEQKLKDFVSQKITPYIIRGMVLNASNHKVHLIESYIIAKNKFGVLLAIDEYEAVPEFLEKIFEN